MKRLIGGGINYRLVWLNLSMIGIGAAIIMIGCSQNDLIDEKNPYFIRGIRHRRQSEYKEAAAAFHKCLRLSPRSAKAHLQLGMLYEDHLHSPVSALYHYTAYTNGRPDGENVEVAKQSILKLQQRLAESWSALYGGQDAGSELNKELQRLQNRVEKANYQKEFILDKLRETNARLVIASKRLEALNENKALQGPLVAQENFSYSDERFQYDVETYSVRQGDSLISIARGKYGDASLWSSLRDYNEPLLKGSETIFIGMELKIPPKKILQEY